VAASESTIPALLKVFFVKRILIHSSNTENLLEVYHVAQGVELLLFDDEEIWFSCS
jgi:hypothetical protein